MNVLFEMMTHKMYITEKKLKNHFQILKGKCK